jgi:hypothetical protein
VARKAKRRKSDFRTSHFHAEPNIHFQFATSKFFGAGALILSRAIFQITVTNRNDSDILSVKWLQPVVIKALGATPSIDKQRRIDTYLWKIGNIGYSVDSQRLNR